MNAQEKIVQWLFATQAIRVSPPDQPFWYASGTLGPFYVNTHFLYGSEQDANQLLLQIDQMLQNPLALPRVVSQAAQAQYQKNGIYQELCHMVAERLTDVDCDFVSGGERRDYFFSFQTARLLGKPHLSLLKDGRAFLSDPDILSTREVMVDGLASQKALHIADLVTEASSYQKSWLPALRRCGAALPITLAIIDRKQGGRKNLAAEGTRLISMAEIDTGLFESALKAGLITSSQFEQIRRFQQNPTAFMERFIHEHPTFLAEQLALGGKNRERAQVYLEKHPAASGKS